MERSKSQFMSKLNGFTIFDDRIVPRAKEILIKPEKDLEKLMYLFGPFKKENINKLRKEAKVANKIAKKYDLIQIAGELGAGPEQAQIIGGADLISWLSGFKIPMILSLTKPETLKSYLEIISEWNMRQIEIYLEVTKVDLIVINCEAGMSRSAGVGAALSKILNGNDTDFFRYFHPNMYIYSKLIAIKS